MKFLSLEPLLGPLTDLDLRGIDWVIVGGESGPKARPKAPTWVVSINIQSKNKVAPKGGYRLISAWIFSIFRLFFVKMLVDRPVWL